MIEFFNEWVSLQLHIKYSGHFGPSWRLPTGSHCSSSCESRSGWWHRTNYFGPEMSDMQVLMIHSRRLQGPRAKETYVIARVNFVVVNEIEFWFVVIRHQNGTFRFLFDFLKDFLWWLFVAPNDVSIVEGTTTGLWQRHQLTVHVRAKHLEDYLKVKGVSRSRIIWRQLTYGRVIGEMFVPVVIPGIPSVIVDATALG